MPRITPLESVPDGPMGQIADQLKKRFRAQVIDELGPDVRTDWLGAEQD